MAIKTAYLKQIKGITFAGRTDSNHWVTMDGPEDFGGCNAGVRPKELILLALAGCTASDVVSILSKKRTPLSDLEINIKAEISEEHPQVFKTIDLEYVVYGDLNARDVERAIDLSQTKYCAVTAMLRASVEINHTYRIVTGKEVHQE